MAHRVSARITDESRRGWDRSCATHGATFTALIEAFGLALDERSWDVPSEIVRRANEIDRERFSRR